MKKKIALLILFLSVSLLGDTQKDHYDKARQEMVTIIEREVESTQGYLGRDKLGAEVIDAMKGVKRHAFVPQALGSGTKS